MTPDQPARIDPRGSTRFPVTGVGIGITRIALGVLVVLLLGYAYGLQIVHGDVSPIDYFGYFTNQTSLLTGTILIATGAYTFKSAPVPAWLVYARAIATACMLIVAVIYNVLVPGTGAAPPWVSAILHAVFPALVVLDWLLVPDRPSLPWRRLWIAFPYPVLWLVGVLVRGVTDGWVPYGFLLPERGAISLWLHVIGLIGALLAAAALVWVMSRFRLGAPRPRQTR